MFDGPITPVRPDSPESTSPSAQGPDARTSEVEIIGHRGYAARAPENTLTSLEAALAAGARSVEFDLHVASCGTPVLFHDINLGRTTNGVGPVRRRTLGQLRALDAGKWFSPEFAGEKVPSFAEALDLLSGRADRVYAEVKGFRELEDLHRMLHIVRNADAMHTTIFISADWKIVNVLRGRADEIAIGFIVETADVYDEGLERAKADPRAMLDLDHRIALAEPSLVARARDAGVDVVVWTVNDPDEATTLREAGVTRFTTDEVERLREWAEA